MVNKHNAYEGLSTLHSPQLRESSNIR